MHINLTFSLYWLLVPIAALLVGLAAYKMRDLGSGPGDALYAFFIMGACLFAFLLVLLGLMAFHLISK